MPAYKTPEEYYDEVIALKKVCFIKYFVQLNNQVILLRIDTLQNYMPNSDVATATYVTNFYARILIYNQPGDLVL